MLAPTSKTDQPQAATEMKLVGQSHPESNQQQRQCENHQGHTNKALRMRGGGAAKDCFLGIFGCFACFECCEGCCDCIGDIVCCPCEMCC